MEKTGLISSRIKELRLKQGLSQVALANALGLNPQTVRDYETGRRNPTLNGLKPLSEALNVSIAGLLDESEEVPVVKSLPVSKTIQKLLNIPDFVYEEAGVFGSGHEVWETVRKAFELQKLKDERKRQTQKGAI